MNKEGYKDPTAEKAIHRAQRLPEKIWEAISISKKFFGILGLNITQIEIEDKKTKKRYRWKREG